MTEKPKKHDDSDRNLEQKLINTVYLEYLAKTGENHKVTATEDIYNKYGALLVSKGDPINIQTTRHLQQQELQISLDNQIGLEHCKSNQGVHNDLLTMINQNPELREIHEKSSYDDALHEFCTAKTFHRTLRQKLTVFSLQLPFYYAETLYVAWACGLIAKEMNLPKEDCISVFTAGLFHNIGLLHITEESVTKGTLSDENWRALHSHTIIGKLIIEETASLPAKVAIGILEHHERYDRTGYPTRKPPEQLGLFGQIIQCADFFQRYCNNELKQQDQPLRSSLPYMRMQAGAFRSDVFNALYGIILRATPASVSMQDIDFESLINRINNVNQWYPELSHLPEEIFKLQETLKQSEPGKAVITSAQTIYNAIKTSGLDSEYLQHWLTSEVSAKDIEVLIEINAMQYELFWLFKRLGWNLDHLLTQISSSGSDERYNTIKPIHNNLCRILDKARSDFTG